MQRTSHSPAAVAGPGLVLRLANGPYGRALIGVALGLALFAAQERGWFSQADLPILDRLSALAHRQWESPPVVVIAAPRGVTEARTHVAAFRNALDAGAVAVGFDDTYLLPRGEASPADLRELRALAADPRCVVAQTGPDGPAETGAPRLRLAAIEQFVQEAHRACRVVARPAYPDGFVRLVAARAVGSPDPHIAPRVERSLRMIDSRAGMLLDYSLRPAPVEMMALEALAGSVPGPPDPQSASLRQRVQGRVVLLSTTPWSAAAWSPSGSRAPRAAESAVAWAIATVLSGSGATEPRPELFASALVLAALLLMLTMGDRGLGGKLVAAAVAAAGLAGLSVSSLVWWQTFVPPAALAAAIAAAFVISVCLELAEAGKLIAQESRVAETGDPRFLRGDRAAPAQPTAAIEETLRAVIGWHGLPAVGLLLKDSARPKGLFVVSAAGSAGTLAGSGGGAFAAYWTHDPSLRALAEEALLSNAPTVGDWPNLAGQVASPTQTKALALPVILDRGRGAALLLATPQLPARPDVVEFGTRMVRQLLATRTPRSPLSPTLPHAAARPHQLPLPAQVARLRASRVARQQQAAVAAAWRAGPHEAVIVFDMAGKPVRWNRRAETLFDGEQGFDVAQTHIVPLLAEALETTEAEVRDAAMGVLLDGAPYIGDLEDPKGMHNYVASLTRVGADGETPVGLALRCIDVTGVCRPARVEARLMSIAAHEMRTPLTTVLGYAELLQDQAEGGSKIERYAGAIHRQAERMEAVVAELLTVTRLEAGREELVVEPVDMGAVAREVAAAMQPLADARRISLSVQATTDVQVRGDVPKLERVVENLVTNAIKYSPEGASVSVRFRRDADRVLLEVQDTGHGIPAEDAPHVFEKFYRAKNQHTESVEGTGLGLAIVRLIAEAHGGSVAVRTVEGAGSTFTVALPVGGPSEKRASDPAA